MKAWRPRAVLVVAAASVDQDRQVVGAHQPGMNAGDEPIALAAVMVRRNPAELALQDLPFEIGEVGLALEIGEPELLLDPGDCRRAESPGCHDGRPKIANGS